MLDFLVLDPELAGRGRLVAAGLSFVWGLGTALCSPCHLGIFPLLGSHAAGLYQYPAEDSTAASNPSASAGQGSRWEEGRQIRHSLLQVLLFAVGCWLTIPLLGFLLSVPCIFMGKALPATAGSHWWTIPIGLLLIWFGRDLFRNHACAHAVHVWDSLRRRLGISANSGLLVLGFGYGLLASGCTVGFLIPLLLLVFQQGLLFCTLVAATFGLGHTLPMVVVACSIPLARRFLHGHRSPHAHDAQGKCMEHTASQDGCLDDPHRGERLFRRVMGALLVIMGLVFLVHPFLE